MVDDSAYERYAEQISHEPTNPYGFEIFWCGEPEPAFDVLAPPGEDPVAWKLSVFPFALVLAAALCALFARFAPGLAVPLLWMSVASPAVLPFLNLMLDVPAPGSGDELGLVDAGCYFRMTSISAGVAAAPSRRSAAISSGA